MAKTPNGVGQFSGKMGGLVYSVRSGQQIVRAYQPIVSNPKTTAQRLQRAKANLVGRISQIVPHQILVGMGDSRVKRRARFLRLAMQNATARVSTSDPSMINAKLDANKFIFSEGVVVPTMSMTNLVTAQSSMTVTMSKIAGVVDAEFLASGAIVVVVMLSTNGNYESVFYRFVSAADFGSQTSISFTFNHIDEGGYTAVGYFAPFATQDGSAMRARADELFGEGADFAANMAYNPEALPVNYGKSLYWQQSEYVPA